MGRRYPERFVDVRIGYWKELTGEDDQTARNSPPAYRWA
jgi:hypothetical protein